jgi:hypothetical protein
MPILATLPCTSVAVQSLLISFQQRHALALVVIVLAVHAIVVR